MLEYWPDARGTDLRDYPNMGAGRGYRPDGTWMGHKPTTRVFLLRNTGTDQEPAFGPPELLGRVSVWDGRTDAALVTWTATVPSSCWCAGTWIGSTPCA